VNLVNRGPFWAFITAFLTWRLLEFTVPEWAAILAAILVAIVIHQLFEWRFRRRVMREVERRKAEAAEEARKNRGRRR
jgi:peptidoglycan/LPS O-acetylase OafA/YrhL